YKLVSQPSLKDELFTWGYPNYGYIATPTSSGFINRNKVLYNESGKELSNLAPLKIANLSAATERVKSIEASSNLLLDFISPNYPFADSSIIQFRTDFLPANCFENLSITLLGNNNFSDVFLKVYVLLKHKSNPNLKPVTMILSYNLKDKLLNADKISTEGFYKCKVWGTDWSVKEDNCCFKC